MLGRVVVENGVKKIVPLTADCGSGNPCGTIIAVYSNQVPYGYLPCNGVAFDTAQFPVLYALLGDNHTPDLRECTLKGIGESGRTVGAHIKAGGLAVGEFVDDRIQNIKVDPDSESSGICTWTDGALIPANSPFTKTTPQTQWQPSSGAMGAFQSLGFDASKNVRAGATTEVKAVGVNWCIKATSGINENQADNVLSALTPVNTVASGNMHAVTSNAVYNALGGYTINNSRSNITDCDTAPDGFFCNNKVAHAPNDSTNYVYLLTLSYNNDMSYKVQICFPINYTTFHIRCKIAGTWTQWIAK